MFYIKKWSAHDLTPEEKEASHISMKEAQIARALIESLSKRPIPGEENNKKQNSSSGKTKKKK